MYDPYFQQYATSMLDWRWLKAQAMSESALDPLAESPVGAKGLCQFMDPTWNEWGNGQSVWHAPSSINAQAKYMTWIMQRPYVYDHWQALAAYNWGIGNVKRISTDESWFTLLPRETRDYLPRINRYFVEFGGIPVNTPF